MVGLYNDSLRGSLIVPYNERGIIVFQTIYNFITEHSTELLALWGALITIAYIVVRLTPTKKDDKVLDTILKVFETLKIDPRIPEDVKKDLQEVEAELEEEINAKDNDRTRDNLIDILKS